jgi:glycine/D-amino acid oxidase-like deaminating enzyme
VTDERFDVVIIGGAIVGSAAAYFLSENTDFHGSVLVIERDPTYARSSTALSAASVRHQFSRPVNIRLSQFASHCIEHFHQMVEIDGQSPDLGFRDTGYLFLAGDEASMDGLRASHGVQRTEGAAVTLLNQAELGRRFPHLEVSDLVGASIGERHEGTLDATSLLQGFRQRARHNGIVYRHDEVVGLAIQRGRVRSVQLASGAVIDCGLVVNAAGPRARLVAEMAGLALPVYPRVRSVFAFDCRELIEGPFPLTVDIGNVWVRREPPIYLGGTKPNPDPDVAIDDFDVRRSEWDDHVWPALAHRIPAFERVKVVRSWAGHYSVNVLDANAVIGPAEELPNFMFANGFSGHGLQHAPGVGRGVAELITYGRYTTIDLTELGYDRIVANRPFREEAIIA